MPLTNGPVDGQGEFVGYPFIGSGCTGYPDAAAVMRSYRQHPALETFYVSDTFGDIGALVIDTEGQPPYLEELDFEVATMTGVRSGQIEYRPASDEATLLAAKYQLDPAEALSGVLFHQVSQELEADLAITNRIWLLEEYRRASHADMSNVVCAEEALALIGLYLRWHQQPVIIGGHAKRWHPTSIVKTVAADRLASRATIRS